MKGLLREQGYLSCCRFVNDKQIITASGDSSCILWDLETRQALQVFNDHGGDVMSVDIFDSMDTFISGSCDSTAKVRHTHTHTHTTTRRVKANGTPRDFCIVFFVFF